MTKKNAIIEFVRFRLGCKCPDEVFETIECQEGEALGKIYTRRMTLGGRLLLYLWKINEPSLVKAHLPAILASGKDERDRRGLNRFRAVIATDDVDTIGPVAQGVFQDLHENDDKVHLHVVPVDEVAGLW